MVKLWSKSIEMMLTSTGATICLLMNEEIFCSSLVAGEIGTS